MNICWLSGLTIEFNCSVCGHWQYRSIAADDRILDLAMATLECNVCGGRTVLIVVTDEERDYQDALWHRCAEERDLRSPLAEICHERLEYINRHPQIDQDGIGQDEISQDETSQDDTVDDMPLRDLRIAQHFTLATLASVSGISSVRLANWESWDKADRPSTARDPLNMSLRSAQRLAKALNVSLDDLASALDD